MFKTIIGVPAGETSNIIKICKDIMKNDRTFYYEVTEPSVEALKQKFESLLILYSPSKKMANERGGWFIHKVRDAKLASYFWVKEASTKKI
jgi:hypothetical protein